MRMSLVLAGETRLDGKPDQLECEISTLLAKLVPCADSVEEFCVAVNESTGVFVSPQSVFKNRDDAIHGISNYLNCEREDEEIFCQQNPYLEFSQSVGLTAIGSHGNALVLSGHYSPKDPADQPGNASHFVFVGVFRNETFCLANPDEDE